MVSYYGCHDSSAKIRNQIRWNDEIKELIWTEIVSEKIRNQRNILKYFNKKEYFMLDEYLSQIEIGDTTNREGHSAKVYFNALFGMDFTRTADNPTNAALNYGYGTLLSTFNREIVANGYITQLGLFHDNMFNHFNLGSDLMEPFRTLVDKIVYNLKPEIFNHDEKMEVLNFLNKEVIIDDKINYVNNAIKIYCKSVFDAINQQDVSLIKFYKDEL
ncbi:MAG: type II CRISPR-associated endonuclease Cas1 [Lachnospirales bacterium]